jgi:hypothetical protein
MKTLFVTALAVTLIATPAFAQECSMTTETGTRVDLTSICHKPAPQAPELKAWRYFVIAPHYRYLSDRELPRPETLRTILTKQVGNNPYLEPEKKFDYLEANKYMTRQEKLEYARKLHELAEKLEMQVREEH